MKILIIGDSNIRNAFVKDKFEKSINASFNYEQAMSNESVKLTLQKAKDVAYNVIFICTMLNELTFNTKNVKGDAGRDSEAKLVGEALRENVVGAAQENKNTEFVVMKPLRRRIPAWIDKKITTYHDMLGKDYSENAKMKNITLIESMEVPDNVLQPDGVHLSKDGLVTLQNHIIERIKSIIDPEDANMDDIFGGEVNATLHSLSLMRSPQ